MNQITSYHYRYTTEHNIVTTTFLSFLTPRPLAYTCNLYYFNSQVNHWLSIINTHNTQASMQAIPHTYTLTHIQLLTN